MSKYSTLKRVYSRLFSLIFIGLILTLNGCGGGGGTASTPVDENPDGSGGINPPIGTLTVSGTIVGNDTSVTLALNGTQETFSGSDFTFTQKLDSNDFYSVSFVSEPNNQACVPLNGAGIITANVTNVTIICSSPITILRYDDAQITGSFADTGDFNGDGMDDLAISIITTPSHSLGNGNSMIRFIFGTGNGAFNNLIDVAYWGSSNAVILDWNNDGFDDYILSGGTIQILTGNNTNIPQVLFTGTEGPSNMFYVFDMDGDGYKDILANVNGSNLRHFAIYRNNTVGGFSSVKYFGFWLFDTDPTTPSIRTVYNYTVNDFNGDGKKDIVAYVDDFTITSDYGLALYPGNSTGGFDLPTYTQSIDNSIFLGNTFPVIDSMISGDFDGDGDIDIAITSTTNYLQIMINNGTGSFTEGQKVIVGTNPVDVLSADFNNDGLLDLVSANRVSRNVIISYGNGDGTFGDSTSNASSWLNIQLESRVDIVNLDISDFDGDSYPDIVVGEAASHLTAAGSIQIIHSPSK